MFVVDTNVLVYAAERSFREHRACRELLATCRRGASAWYVTWGILYEFVRVATHPRVFRRPWSSADAWRFVEALLAAESLGLLIETPRHADVAAQTIALVPSLCGNLVHDGHTAVLMREHGIRRIYTRDRDFRIFPFLEVLDPV